AAWSPRRGAWPRSHRTRAPPPPRRRSSLRVVVAEHAHLELAGLDGSLDQELAVEAGCQPKALDQLLAVVGLGGADARARVRKLRETRIAKLLLHQAHERLRILLEVPTGDRQVVHHRQADSLECLLHVDL